MVRLFNVTNVPIDVDEERNVQVRQKYTFVCCLSASDPSSVYLQQSQFCRCSEDIRGDYFKCTTIGSSFMINYTKKFKLATLPYLPNCKN